MVFLARTESATIFVWQYLLNSWSRDASVLMMSSVMATAKEYATAIRKFKWPGLLKLWNEIVSGTVDGWWEEGMAFEYMIVRMFELDDARVTWPYDVKLFDGGVTEQIDGSVRFNGLNCLIESKDRAHGTPIDPIAKLRNQLLRRPAGTVGLVFAKGHFTPSTVLLSHFALPQAILLWTGKEVEYSLQAKKVCDFADEKFRACVEHGIVDYDITVT
jgi:hypothetical protein